VSRTYRERLTPPPIWWVVAVLVGGSFGLVLLRLAATTGLVIGALVGAGIACGILAFTSATVAVDGAHLSAGRASIPVTLLGDVEILDRERMGLLRGRDIDARAYLCQRGWIPAGLRVVVADPSDPTPYWLISSRRPRALADALHAARATPIGPLPPL
jgi:hypothetical protein